MPDIGASVYRQQDRAGEPRSAPLRLITSLVQRVSSEADRTLFVEARQSELTVTPRAPRDDDAEDAEGND
jgi:hypothetical protein